MSITAVEWRNANCLGVDPTTFFPERGDMQAIKDAKRICNGCVLRDACLEENLHEQFGVWGGKTPVERQQLRGARIRSLRSVNR